MPAAARASSAYTATLELSPVCGMSVLPCSDSCVFRILRIGDGAAFFHQSVDSGGLGDNGVIAVLHSAFYQHLAAVSQTVNRQIRGIIACRNREADAHRAVGGYFVAVRIQEFHIVQLELLAHVAEGGSSSCHSRPLW